MKLEDAIREGSKKTTQYYGWFRNDDLTSTCALGAALLAVNGPDRQMYTTDLWDAFPETKLVTGYMGRRGLDQENLGEAIALANDHGATREEIADWIQWLREGGAL